MGSHVHFAPCGPTTGPAISPQSTKWPSTSVSLGYRLGSKQSQEWKCPCVPGPCLWLLCLNQLQLIWQQGQVGTPNGAKRACSKALSWGSNATRPSPLQGPLAAI